MVKAEWIRKQLLMQETGKIQSDYTRKIWNDEQVFLAANHKCLAVNIGSGTAPIKCDVDVDPLVSRTVKAIGELLPLKNECCGTVAVFSVLDHVIDDVALLKEAYRILTKDGVVLIMQNVLGWREKLWLLRHKDQNHMRHYLFDWQLKRCLRMAGFHFQEWTVKFYGHDRVVFVVCKK